MKRAREEDGDAGDAVPEETGSPVARPSPSADAPGAIADRREKNTPTADHDPPDPALAVYEGARASVTLKPEFAKGLRAADVHELVTWVLTPDGPNPRWAFVRHKPVVRRVLMILAPGLDEARCASAAELMPNIRAHLGKGVPTNHDNATANEITVARAVLCSVREDAPNSGKARSHSSYSSARDESLGGGGGAGGGAKRTAAARTSTAAADLCGRPMPFPPEHYALTPKQMVEMDYPTPTFAGPGPGPARDASDGERALNENALIVPEGFVVTQPAGGGVARSPPLSMLAVDCEMCYVGAGADRRLALTRASAVGPDGSVVYDKLCAPREPITDYNTAHSGITAEQMRGVTTTLEDVQRDLLELIAQETVLIGHSLENDLRRMRIMHATCVDTVALYPHPRGPPFRSKLSALTEKHLARRIQEGTHDSVADARATMELALLKFTNGPGFGEPAGAGGSLFEACAAAGARCAAFDRRHVLDALLPSGGPPGTKTFPCVADAHVTAELAKEVANIREDVDRATDAVGQVPGAEEAVAPRGSSRGGAFFAFAHLRGYYEHLDGAAKRWAAATGARLGSTPAAAAEAEYRALKQAREQKREAPKTNASASSDADASPASDADNSYDEVEESVVRDAALLDLDADVGRAWDALPPGSMLVLVTGVGNAPKVKTLQERKWKRAQALGPWGKWTDEAEAELRLEAERARRGMLFAAVKND